MDPKSLCIESEAPSDARHALESSSKSFSRPIACPEGLISGYSVTYQFQQFNCGPRGVIQGSDCKISFTWKDT